MNKAKELLKSVNKGMFRPSLIREMTISDVEEHYKLQYGHYYKDFITNLYLNNEDDFNKLHKENEIIRRYLQKESGLDYINDALVSEYVLYLMIRKEFETWGVLEKINKDSKKLNAKLW